MINKSIFREYDIRGIYKEELNQQSVKLPGYYLGKRIHENKVVAIGYDVRSHSPIPLNYLTSGLNASGCEVLDMGLVATPVNYFTNYQEIDLYRCDGSIMITGSHNLSEYNGFKITMDQSPFFGKDSTEELKVETTEEEKFLIIQEVKKLLKSPPADFPGILNIIEVDGVRINFEHGWGLVRASNTTPVLVTRFESTDKDMVMLYQSEINKLIMKAQNDLRASC